MFFKKLLFSIFLLFFVLSANSQETKYFNADWKQTTKDKAVYYRPAPEKKKKGDWVIDYYMSGNKAQEVYYINGKPDGKYAMYYPTGELKITGKYQEGNKEGVWKTYYKNGKIKERGKYADGEKVGIWKTFYKNI